MVRFRSTKGNLFSKPSMVPDQYPFAAMPQSAVIQSEATLSYHPLQLRRVAGYTSQLVLPDRFRQECESQQGRSVATVRGQRFGSER